MSKNKNKLLLFNRRLNTEEEKVSNNKDMNRKYSFWKREEKRLKFKIPSGTCGKILSSLIYMKP